MQAVVIANLTVLLSFPANPCHIPVPELEGVVRLTLRGLVNRTALDSPHLFWTFLGVNGQTTWLESGSY